MFFAPSSSVAYLPYGGDLKRKQCLGVWSQEKKIYIYIFYKPYTIYIFYRKITLLQIHQGIILFFVKEIIILSNSFQEIVPF